MGSTPGRDGQDGGLGATGMAWTIYLALPVLFPVSFVFTYCFEKVYKMPRCVNSFCDVLDRSGGLRIALVSS